MNYWTQLSINYANQGKLIPKLETKIEHILKDNLVNF